IGALLRTGSVSIASRSTLLRGLDVGGLDHLLGVLTPAVGALKLALVEVVDAHRLGETASTVAASICVDGHGSRSCKSRRTLPRSMISSSGARKDPHVVRFRHDECAVAARTPLAESSATGGRTCAHDQSSFDASARSSWCT